MSKILVVDVGGNNVKIRCSGEAERRKSPSGPEFTPRMMVDTVSALAGEWVYDRVTIGFPGPVGPNGSEKNPLNLGPGWVGFDFAAAFERPTKLVNDAAMQALGSYEGGRMLFLGLGTGLGACLVLDGGVVAPLEVAHLPYKDGGTFEDFTGARGFERLGPELWAEEVANVVTMLKDAMVADYVVLGGGAVKLLTTLPPGVLKGRNSNAFIGGFKLWEHVRCPHALQEPRA